MVSETKDCLFCYHMVASIAPPLRQHYNYQMNGYDITADNTSTTRMRGSVSDHKSLGMHRDVGEVQDIHHCDASTMHNQIYNYLIAQVCTYVRR